MRLSVVVARFQTPSLHVGHTALLEKAIRNSDHLVIFLGVSAIAGTKRNPMDYATRHVMVNAHMQEYFPMFPFSIEPIVDLESDKDWSKMLDSRIDQHVKYGDEVILFGGKDSFLNNYDGKYKKHERLESAINHNATALRHKLIKEPPKADINFRQGVLYAIGNMRDTVACTVDIACLNDVDEVLIGRKDGEKHWRFPGGFVDSTDENLSRTACREFFEETNLTFEGDIHYVGSRLSDDWRWRNSPDKAVMTNVFIGYYKFGVPIARDDLVELKWCNWKKSLTLLTKSHQALHGLINDWRIKNDVHKSCSNN